MTREHYEEDWGRHNATPHTYYTDPEKPQEGDDMPRYLLDGLRSMTHEQQQDVKDLMTAMLKRLLAIIVTPATRTRQKASAIAARAVLLHRTICNPAMNTRDMAEAYGVPNNAVYDEQKALCRDLKSLAPLLH